MANSYIHAVSSHRRFGGELAQHIAVHDWFDRSKEAYANFRHRAIRHNDYGVHLAGRVFSGDWVDAGVLSKVAERHVVEDLGHVPTLGAWFGAISPNRPFFHAKEMMPDEHCSADARKWGGTIEDYRALHEFIDETRQWFDDSRHRAVHHHAMGCFTAEKVFGVVIPLAGKRPIPTRWVVEAHISRELGQIPSLQDWVAPIKAEKWMNSVAWKPRSLDEAEATAA
jgi:hypothetical protein